MATIDYTKFLDGNALKAIRTWITTNYQPLHANLTSIAALATNQTGLIKMTNGVASLDGTTYAPLNSPSFTGTPTLPTTTKIGTLTSTGFVKYTNGVLSVTTLSASDIPNLSASKITSGTFDIARIPTGTTSTTVALGNHTHALNLESDTGTSAITLASGGKYKLTAGGSTLIFTMPEISVFPSTTTANKVLLSTSTSGSVAWSSWSSAGFLKTKTDGSVEVDTTSYVPTSRTINGKALSGNVTLYGTDIAASSTLATKLIVNGKIPTSLLPDAVLGQLEYKGTFNASLAQVIENLEKGWYYVCSTAGSNNPDGTTGPSDGYAVGDWAVYNGTSWDKIDNSDKVSSVAGKTGAVTLAAGDIASGTFDIARIPTGTTATTVALGNHTHTTKIVTPSLPIAEPLTLAFGSQYELQAGGTTFQFKMPARGTDNDHYPTTFTWTNGSTAGPTGSLSGNSGFSAVSFGAIPSASNSQSGVVTTGSQIFGGQKTFYGDVILGQEQGCQVKLQSNGQQDSYIRLMSEYSSGNWGGLYIYPIGDSNFTGTRLEGYNNIIKLAGTVKMDHVLTEEECTAYLNTGSWNQN